MEEEKRRKEKEAKPWWSKYMTGRYGDINVSLGETTPPPEDDHFPKVRTGGFSFLAKEKSSKRNVNSGHHSFGVSTHYVAGAGFALCSEVLEDLH